MAETSKLVIKTHARDLAMQVAGALRELIDVVPDAVTVFEDANNGWLIEAYYSEPPDMPALGTLLASFIGEPLPPINLETVPDLNWVSISQSALPPVSAGRFIVHGSHDSGRIPRGPNTIRIDAGEAFGTAHHATTLGCLMAIDRLTRRRRHARVLDLGCGSGVLAIAAARALPTAEIIATDIDRQSIVVAGANIKANGVHQRIATVCGAGLAHPWVRHAKPFDLAIANILAGPLRQLAPGLGKAVAPGGNLVLAGLLTPEAPAVLAAYRAQGFGLVQHQRIEDWSILTLLKRG